MGSDTGRRDKLLIRDGEMIITRTPFRISFFGGGTDYPAWYRQYGGAVLSASINKYCYINCRYLPPFFDYRYRIRYTKREETQKLADIQHPSVRECIKSLGIEKGVEMVHTADIPARSGVGSSSSFTVGFLHALHALQGRMVTKRQLARDAIKIEQEVIGENVGSQDQVAAAFGGLNRIDFGGEREFYVTPLTLPNHKVEALESRIMLFFTGFARNASDIAGEQIKNTLLRKAELSRMHEMVDEAIEALNTGEMDGFGRLLHESWQIKRKLTGLITTDTIDGIYETGMKAGALGGKLLGAGGGGFIMFYVPPERQSAVREALKSFLYVPFRFDFLGSQVIMYSTQDFY